MAMSFDGAVQVVFGKLDGVRWRGFDGEKRYQWYYAEESVYLIMEVKTEAVFFIRAKSPVKALETVKARVGGG